MIKGLIKKLIYKICAKTDLRILPILEKKTIVSFDVFDTLVKRDTEDPSYVFDLMEKELKIGKKTYAEGFSSLRQEMEKKAKEVHPNQEVTLKEIYSLFPFEENVRQELMNMECRLEVEISTPHIPIQNIYKICLEQGKKILFISDMYLPADVMKKLLEKNGYKKGTLYVSSDSGFTKRSGGLFALAQEKEKIDKKQWMHIGDHILSDYLIPRKLGIRSCLIARSPKYNPYVDKKTYRRNNEYRQLNHFIDTRISRYDDPFQQIGYAVLGPLLYGFSKWIEREVPEDESIVFFAREGELLQKAFQVISKRSSVYLYISRRAAMGAYLSQHEEYSEVSQIRLWSINKKHTYKELVSSYGFSDHEIETLFETAGLDAGKTITSVTMQEEVLKAIWPSIKLKSNKQHDLLQRYLEQLKISKEIAAVDVGWRGTVLYLLNKANLTEHDEVIHCSGYYMGIYKRPSSSMYYDVNMKGFLFGKELNSVQSRIHDYIRSTIAFFELLFLSTDGTTEGYAENDCGEVYPVKKENTNVDQHMLEANLVERMQNAGLQFVRDMSKSPVLLQSGPAPLTSIGNYLALVQKVSPKTIRSFRQLRSRRDDEGNSLIYEHELVYYLLHPRKFVNDFMRSECKAWFLRGVFKLPLPYVALLNIIRKFFETN